VGRVGLPAPGSRGPELSGYGVATGTSDAMGVELPIGVELPPGDGLADGAGAETAAIASLMVDQPALNPARIRVPPGPLRRRVGVDSMPAARPWAVSSATAFATAGSSRQAANAVASRAAIPARVTRFSRLNVPWFSPFCEANRRSWKRQ
jgi:hypothetical protein